MSYNRTMSHVRNVNIFLPSRRTMNYRSSIFDHIILDDHSATPKYQQLVNCIINAIQKGKIKKDEILPSLTELSIEFEISRDTAERGYKHLKDAGVLGSVPGK